MSDSDDYTIGIYVGTDADLIADFDEYFETKPGRYSRSEQVKKAMRLYLAVRRTVDGFEYDLDERALRHSVTDALQSKDRYERESADE